MDNTKEYTKRMNNSVYHNEHTSSRIQKRTTISDLGSDIMPPHAHSFYVNLGMKLHKQADTETQSLVKY